MTTARTRVHAFRDDALGDHDAVGLAEEIRSGRVSRREAVQAAVARTTELDSALNGLAVDRFSSAMADAAVPHDRFFAGVPSFGKDNRAVAGLPPQRGPGAYVAEPAAVEGDFARMFALVGARVLGKTRLSEYGFSPSAEFEHD